MSVREQAHHHHGDDQGGAEDDRNVGERHARVYPGWLSSNSLGFRLSEYRRGMFGRHESEALMNPLDETGIAVEDQLRNWSELNVDPYDKRAVEPYTRTRVILMNGIEVESIMFSHQFARNTDNLEIKWALAPSRRVESQQQQQVVNGLNPGDQTPLETTIGYELYNLAQERDIAARSVMTKDELIEALRS